MSLKQDEIEQWLNAVAGRPDVDLPEHIKQEAKMIRALMIERAEMQMPAVDELQVQRFIKKLKQEKIIKESELGKSWFSKLQLNQTWLALAASMACLTIALSWILPISQTTPSPDDVIWRGEMQSQVIKADNFVAKANQIELLLKQNYLMVRRIDNTKYVRLQAKIPNDAISLKESLKMQGVEVPEHGRLDLIILAK